MKKYTLLFLSIFFVVSFGASAAVTQTLTSGDIAKVISAYRQYKEITNLGLATPTVVEVPLEQDSIKRFNFAVLNTTSNLFEPHYFRQELVVNKIPLSITANTFQSRAQSMLDNSQKTYAAFDLSDSGQGTAKITLRSAIPVTSSSLSILLDNHVALPSKIEIRAVVNGVDKIIVASRKLGGESIRFPKTTSGQWTITLTYGQPLRITELRLSQDNAQKVRSRALRFLAQPEYSYRIYFDPDRYAAAPVGEAGNLASNEDVFEVSPVKSVLNPGYSEADVDGDGVPDARDNCVSLSNAAQEDINNNGRGDVCDDFDKDRIVNSKDNCPNKPNRLQGDKDGDGIGDVCDGEESRLTERYNWLPWVGIGFAAIVLIALFAITAKSMIAENKRED